MTKEKNFLKTFSEYLFIMLLAVASATCFHIFIFPNDFAPAGLGGIITMIQYKLDFNVGYMTLIINIPLAIAVYFFANKAFALRSSAFVAVFSILIIVFDEINFYSYNAGNDKILAAFAAGAIAGIIYGYALRLDASTGGTDLVAALIHEKRKDFSFVWIAFFLNAAVAVASFFVYENMSAAILSVLYTFLNTVFSDVILKGFKSALKIEIITDNPEEIKEALFMNIKHGITKLDAVGMYSGTNKSLLICVIAKRQLADFKKVISSFQNTFVYVSSVNEIYGLFRNSKHFDQE